MKTGFRIKDSGFSVLALAVVLVTCHLSLATSAHAQVPIVSSVGNCLKGQGPVYNATTKLYDCQSISPLDPFVSSRRFWAFVAQGNGTSKLGQQQLPATSCNAEAENLPTSSIKIPTHTFSTSTALANICSFANTGLEWFTGFSITGKFKLNLVATTERRVFVGFTATGAGNMVTSDNFAATNVGFAYCNDSGATCTADNTNWQCVYRDGGNQVVADSGVAASTAMTEFEIYNIDVGGTPTTINWKINGAQVCTASTGLPATATGLRWTVEERNLAAGATRDINVGYIFTSSDF